jgi:hypothetical protein
MEKLWKNGKKHQNYCHFRLSPLNFEAFSVVDLISSLLLHLWSSSFDSNSTGQPAAILSCEEPQMEQVYIDGESLNLKTA